MELKSLLGQEGFDRLDLEAMENLFKAKSLSVAARFLEKIVNSDKSDHTGATAACIFCGAQARYVDHRSKTFTTVLGDITAEDRAYYYCHSCGHGWCPKDYTLGFGESSLSPGVIRLIGMVAAEDPFMKGSKIFSALTGLPLSAKWCQQLPVFCDKVGHLPITVF